ncbi:ATP-binding cassette domain-containing protein [Phytoactinopolyspora alkaliphila]|uniref:ATP-binding cassette domain-containing protein n=1 Tax=Phytoactinopolyspora alkaliphila TaxID=1783498 RepID=A0A6N9YQ48_9ACTN|nr:oligopeptide/dipeptide ABC transporter ATP-binding protein [Phytoactinopolyspora alkaliphila]NED96949.1 ATP-binding cassette domain-containing protein [Phytoactinopolyspora alkaliphila]
MSDDAPAGRGGRGGLGALTEQPAQASPAGDVLVEASNLEVHFPIRSGTPLRGTTGHVRAVDGVDLQVRRGETLGLVGESGCGKSTLGNALLRLVEPTAGSVVFDGVDLTSMKRSQLRALRRRMAMIFQDPFASLDPRRTVGDTIGEPLAIHGLHRGRDRRRGRVGELMEVVGLNPDHHNRYPHEFSGGQRQRVGIARALAGEPDFVVCDEPIASLDVSVQAQVVNLLRRLQSEFGLTYLFVSHDLAAVRQIADRVAVMYLGRVVEVGPATSVVASPQHPYTEALVSAIPVPVPARERERERIVLHGDIPSPANPPSGCRFRTRCPKVFEPCPDHDPVLQLVGDQQEAACHLHGVTG